MANICENLLIIRGDTKTIKYFLKPFSSKSNLFDFDKIIPIPESYYKDNNKEGSFYDSGSVNDKELKNFLFEQKGEEGKKMYDKITDFYDGKRNPGKYSKAIKKMFSNGFSMKTKFPIGKKMCQNYTLYGAKDWYDWCTHYWKTKWNAENTVITYFDDGAEISFLTAWNPPYGIIEKLAELISENYLDGNISFVFKYSIEGDCLDTAAVFENGRLTLY